MTLPDVINVRCASCNKEITVGKPIRTEDPDQRSKTAGTEQATGTFNQLIQSEFPDQWPRKVGTGQATATAGQKIQSDDSNIGPVGENLVGFQCKNCHSYFCRECEKNNIYGSTKHKYQRNNCPKCSKFGQFFNEFLRQGYNPKLVWLENQSDTIKRTKEGMTTTLVVGPIAIVVLAVIGFVVWSLGINTGNGILRWILFAVGIAILGGAWTLIKEVVFAIPNHRASHDESQCLVATCTYCHEYVLLYSAKFQYACESCTKLVEIALRNSSFLPQALSPGLNCTHCQKPNPLKNRPAAFRCNHYGQINDLEKIPYP